MSCVFLVFAYHNHTGLGITLCVHDAVLGKSLLRFWESPCYGFGKVLGTVQGKSLVLYKESPCYSRDEWS